MPSGIWLARNCRSFCRPGIQYEPVESQIVADDSCGDAIRALQSCIEMEARARYFIENVPPRSGVLIAMK